MLRFFYAGGSDDQCGEILNGFSSGSGKAEESCHLKWNFMKHNVSEDRW